MPAKAGIDFLCDPGSRLEFIPDLIGDGAERRWLKRYTLNGTFSPSGTANSNVFSVTDTRL
jgi:hypothetical protein